MKALGPWRGIKAAEGVKGTEQLTLTGGYPALWGGHVLTRDLRRKRAEGVGQAEWERENDVPPVRREHPTWQRVPSASAETCPGLGVGLGPPGEARTRACVWRHTPLLPSLPRVLLAGGPSPAGPPAPSVRRPRRVKVMETPGGPRKQTRPPSPASVAPGLSVDL